MRWRPCRTSKTSWRPANHTRNAGAAGDHPRLRRFAVLAQCSELAGIGDQQFVLELGDFTVELHVTCDRVVVDVVAQELRDV